MCGPSVGDIDCGRWWQLRVDTYTMIIVDFVSNPISVWGFFSDVVVIIKVLLFGNFIDLPDITWMSVTSTVI